MRPAMLKILERSITLQLLILYSLFLLPLLLGGVELYFFERDTLQQSSQRADLGLAQAIAFAAEADVRTVSEGNSNFAHTQTVQHLTAQLIKIQQQSSASEISIWIVDKNGRLLAGTDHLPQMSPDLENSLKKISGSLIARQQGHDWSYSFITIEGTTWKVIVGRPVDIILIP